MTPASVRRLAGALGLVALVPTALLLIAGRVSVVDAAVRAAVTLLVVVIASRVVEWWVGHMSARIDAAEDDASTGELPVEQPPRRRAEDASPDNPNRQSTPTP